MDNTQVKTRTAVIIGAGPGLGAAVARRLGRDGFDIALLARTQKRVADIGEQLQADGVTAAWTSADVAEPDQLRAGVERFGRHTGRIDVLHYNAVAFRPARASELTAQQLLDDVAVGTAGLLTAAAAARAFMPAGSVILATGSVAGDRPMRSAASLGVQKAALRNLVLTLDRDLRDSGIRAAIVTVNGTIKQDSPFDPARIADVFADLVAQARTGSADWRTEVAFNG